MLDSFNSFDFSNKKVLLREDFNVPIDYDNEIILDNSRIIAAVPTIKFLLNKNAKICIISHLGRPKTAQFAAPLSLKIIVQQLANILKQEIKLADSINSAKELLLQHNVVILENIRFFPGEMENDLEFAKALASIADVVVMDAFATAHRAHASTAKVITLMQHKLAGPLLIQEIKALNNIFKAPKHPILAIIGGAKVSSKLAVINNLLPKVDKLILGGGMANTFLHAAGYNIGDSLYEPELLNTAIEILQQNKDKILLPIDVVVDTNLEGPGKLLNLDSLDNMDKIFDIGPKTLNLYKDIIFTAQTILWNGPVGVFEKSQFSNGTLQLANFISKAMAYSVAGGGDTLAAINMAKVANDISYISTGGGAFLEFIAGKALPGLVALGLQ